MGGVARAADTEESGVAGELALLLALEGAKAPIAVARALFGKKCAGCAGNGLQALILKTPIGCLNF